MYFTQIQHRYKTRRKTGQQQIELPCHLQSLLAKGAELLRSTVTSMEPLVDHREVDQEFDRLGMVIFFRSLK